MGYYEDRALLEHCEALAGGCRQEAHQVQVVRTVAEAVQPL